MTQIPQHLILFDGVCNFCDNTVQWIIRSDKKNIFFFTSLQSEIGQEILLKNNIDPKQTDSVVYVRNQNVYVKSDAVLYILKDLGSWKAILYPLIILPAFIRNFFYDQFAKRRYLLFGKKEECMIPTKEVRSKFL